MSAPETPPAVAADADKQVLNKRLESIGWALFLILIGLTALFPGRVPEGISSIGIGLIMLCLNAARYMNGIKMSTFTLVLGFVALVSGIGELMGVDLPILAMLLILAGLNAIRNAVSGKK